MTTAREDRFRELSAEVSGPLRGYVVRRAASADVDDVLSEVSVVLWRRLDEVPAEHPLPWCFAVARRQLANHRRGAGRRLRLLDRIRTVDPPRETVPEDRADDPAYVEVHEALARLGELDREVVTLWAWEQLAPREIAEVTGLSANAVSIRLHRAKKRLAADLADSAGRRKNGPGAGHVPGEGK